jgi:choline-glycine betaine transporter
MDEQRGKIDVTVFSIAAGISAVFVLVGVLFQDELASVVGDVLSW